VPVEQADPVADLPAQFAEPSGRERPLLRGHRSPPSRRVARASRSSNSEG
jgi:hypothetical protein